MRSLLASLVLVAPLQAQIVARAPTGAAPIPSAAFGAAFGQALGASLQSISLRGNASLLPSLQSLREAAAQPKAAPEAKAAAVFLLGTLGQDPAALRARLAATDLPKPVAQRLVQVAQHMAKAAPKDPALAKALAAPAPVLGGSVETPAGRETAGREASFSAKLNAAVEGFLRATGARADAEGAAQMPGAPAAVPEAPVAPRAPQLEPGRPAVSYGGVTLPAIAFPSEGTVIADLWTQAHAVSHAASIVAYNFDDMDIARSIVEKSKRGEPQALIGDYSNWFPHKLSPAAHGGSAQGRTQAMEYVLANLNPNLKLYILKGLGSIGINHNKFTVFSGPAGELLQSGSFNYTKTSQEHHWENVVFTDDARRIELFKAYFAWLTRRARPFSEDLQPADPVFDPADPILTDTDPAVTFHGVPFPRASFSPDGGTEAWLVKAESLVRQALDILMFSPFPTPDMVAQIEALLAKDVPVRMLADAGELSMASKILIPLMEKGMGLRVIHGPDMALHGQPWSQSSKQHEKVMVFDGGQADGIAKLGDSLNISRNALSHNFENTQFWSGPLVAVMQAHFDYVWGLATAVTKEALTQMAEKNAQRQAAEGRVQPWEGPSAVAQPVPAS